MELTVELAGDPPVISITGTGRATADDLRRLDEFLARPEVRPGIPILADHSGLDTSGLGGDEVRELGRSYRRLFETLGDIPVAIVVSEPAAFGLARMAELSAGEPKPRQRIFYDRDEALEWLRSAAAE